MSEKHYPAGGNKNSLFPSPMTRGTGTHYNLMKTAAFYPDNKIYIMIVPCDATSNNCGQKAIAKVLTADHKYFKM